MTKDNLNAVFGICVALSVVGFLVALFIATWDNIEDAAIFYKISISLFAFGAISSILTNIFYIKNKQS